MVQSVLSLNFYSKYLGLDFHIQQPGDGRKCSTSAGLIFNDLHINTISVTGPVINHVGVGWGCRETHFYLLHRMDACYTNKCPVKMYSTNLFKLNTHTHSFT